MANQWLRLWHDMPNDPKWRTIARVSKQPVSLVLAMYCHLLVDASRNVTRGHVDVTNEDLASALDVTEGDIEAVRHAMNGRVLENEALSGWAARQPKREDYGDDETGVLSPAQRKKAQREREKAAAEAALNGVGVTHSHAMSRNVTTDKDKDKDKEKNKHTPTISRDIRDIVTIEPQGCVSGVEEKQQPETKPTVAGQICKALESAGMPDVSPSHPELLALISKGVTVDQFADAAKLAVEKSKGFAYMLGIVKVQLNEVSAIESAPGMPGKAWNSNPQSVAEMGQSLNVKPWVEPSSENAFRGEPYAAYLMRVTAAVESSKQAVAA